MHYERRQRTGEVGPSGMMINSRGEGTLHSGGYMIVNLKTGFVFKHRLVMQEKLGRKLHKHETVHHKDGNRLNNLSLIHI